MEQLTGTYRITDSGLRLRREFMRFGQEDIAILARLQGWAQKVSEPLVKEFYEHQFRISSTRAFFEDFGTRKHMSMDQLRKHLEQAQRGYFQRIFDEAVNGGQYGTKYFDKRSHVGRLHNSSTFHSSGMWAVTPFTRTWSRSTCKSLRFRPSFAPKLSGPSGRCSITTSRQWRTPSSTTTCSPLALTWRRVNVERLEHDLSEHYADLKSVVRDTLEETGRTSRLLSEYQPT